MTPTVADTCAGIEDYFRRLEASGRIDLDVETVAPADPAAVERLAELTGGSLPEDVRAYLERGLAAASGALDGPDGFGAVGFDLLDADGALEATRNLRALAADLGEDAGPMRDGVALTFCEPQLIVVPGDGVYHFSTRNPVVRVCGSWSEFLAAWLATGCFGSHSFDVLWAAVSDLVGPEPRGNVWLDYYRATFPDAR